MQTDIELVIRAALNSSCIRRGSSLGIEPDDLRQVARVALHGREFERPGLAFKTARDAMGMLIRKERLVCRGRAVTEDGAGLSSDPFSFMPLRADGIAGNPQTLESRHDEWEVGRAALWASVRGGSEVLQAVA